MDLNKKIKELKPQQLNCNVFDVYSYNGLTMQDLLCQFFTTINECVKSTNEVIDLTEWLVSVGLEEEVVKKLMALIEDGTVEKLINVNLFKTLNNEINGLSSQLEHKANKNEVRANTTVKPINHTEFDTETKKLFTGGNVAVVEEDSVGCENIKINAIRNSHVKELNVDSINEIELIEKRYNIFDKTKRSEYGYSLDSTNGELIKISTSWCVTGFVEVEPLDKISFLNSDRNVGADVCYYDCDCNFVLYKQHANTDVTIEVPNKKEIKYMRRTIDHWFVDNGMIVKGEDTTFNQYIPYQDKQYEFENLDITKNLKKYGGISVVENGIEIPNLLIDKEEPVTSGLNKRLTKFEEKINFGKSKNIFNGDNFKVSYALDLENGEEYDITNSAWGVSPFIEVTPNETIVFTYYYDTTSSDAVGDGICYYDKYFNFVSSERVTNTTFTIQIPNNEKIKYMKRTMNKKFATGGIVTKSDTSLHEYVKYEEFIKIPSFKVESEDGEDYTLAVNKFGELEPIPTAHLNLPTDFPKYTFTGESSRKEDFYITPHTDNNDNCYIFIMNHKGYVKKYKKLPAFAYNFRKYKNSNGEVRYIYCQTVNKEYPKVSMNGGYDNTKLVVMDKDFSIIDEAILLPYGNVGSSGHVGENHDYIYIDDGHYILLAYQGLTVNNIPNLSGEYKVINCIIQEQKNDEVLFHWESVNESKMYEYSAYNNSFSNYPATQGTYNDYCHINSVEIDSRNGDLLCSFRHTGVCKISRTTGELLWHFGKRHVDIKNMETPQLGFLQHQAKYNYDGSITIFDNYGCATNNTRCCRYWIDEETLTLNKFEELVTPRERSAFMGSMDLLHKDKNIYMIAYGSGWKDIAFHEYDFDLERELCRLTFDNGSDLYRVWRDYILE